MKLQLSILSLILMVILGCTSEPIQDPSGPVARFGTTPTINGVFEEGEWNDAEVVQVDSSWQFRIKHDGANLYFGLDGAGGNLWFKNGNDIHILHASWSICREGYTVSGSSARKREKERSLGLYRLQNQSADVIQDSMTVYLADSGWVASLIPMGNMPQTEFAVSFDWLGIAGDRDTARFAEISSIYVFSCPNLPPDELKGRAGWWHWPELRMPDDSLSRGRQPETINAAAIEWGKIWIDLDN